MFHFFLIKTVSTAIESQNGALRACNVREITHALKMHVYKKNWHYFCNDRIFQTVFNKMILFALITAAKRIVFYFFFVFDLSSRNKVFHNFIMSTTLSLSLSLTLL